MGPGRHRVTWSEAAYRELEEAAEYIAERSPESAARLVESLLQAGDSLADLSDRGRVVRELADPSVRELQVPPYRLVYAVKATSVVILGILHQRRDFDGGHTPARPVASAPPFTARTSGRWLRHMPSEGGRMNERRVRPFRNGRNQAIRIPREFELPGEEAILRREGGRLILEPTVPVSLVALLDTLEPLADDFPAVPDLPIDDVDI